MAPPGESRWVSDPASPVPTLGGKLCCHPGFMPGTFDHTSLAARTDVLVFTSEPVRTPLRVMGPGELRARVRVDAPDTDLVAKLMEVAPGGKSVVLADGVLRLRYRLGEDREQFLKPGKPEGVTVALGPVTHQFAAGTRIRLFVAASDFPNSSVNPQTSEPIASARGKRKTTITLIHGGAEGSRLRLPVLE